MVIKPVHEATVPFHAFVTAMVKSGDKSVEVADNPSVVLRIFANHLFLKHEFVAGLLCVCVCCVCASVCRTRAPLRYGEHYRAGAGHRAPADGRTSSPLRYGETLPSTSRRSRELTSPIWRDDTERRLVARAHLSDMERRYRAPVYIYIYNVYV